MGVRRHLLTALLLLPTSTAASSGCSGAAAAGAEPAFVRVERAPAASEVRSEDRLNGAPTSVRLRSLYGLSLEIPPGWRETSAVAFVSEVGPLLQLGFIDEQLTRGEIEEWMAEAVREGNDPSRGTSATSRRFDNPDLSILGIESRWAQGPGKQWIVYVSLETRAVLVHPHCLDNCDRVLETIFRTLRPTRERSAPPEPVALTGGRFLLRTREFEFESTQELENPDRFSFEANDRSGELRCSRSSTPEQLDGPEWQDDFELDSEARIIGSTAELITTPVFQGQRWSATVDAPEGRRNLTYAEVSAQVGSFTFQCVFQREGAIRESFELLDAVLATARKD